MHEIARNKRTETSMINSIVRGGFRHEASLKLEFFELVKHQSNFGKNLLNQLKKVWLTKTKLLKSSPREKRDLKVMVDKKAKMVFARS